MNSSWDRQLSAGFGRSSWALIAVDRFYADQDAPKGLEPYLRSTTSTLVRAVQAGAATPAWAVETIAAIVFELSRGDKSSTAKYAFEVADQLGVSETDVWSGLDAYGVVRRDRSAPNDRSVVQNQLELTTIAYAGDPWSLETFPQVDIAVVTVLPEEYAAFVPYMEHRRTAKGTDEQPNQYSWELGEITAEAERGTYRVVLGLTGQAGSGAGQMAVNDIVRAFGPRHVVLLGVAGGFAPSQLGDVVVSDTIYGYEYGKVDETGFHPRPDWTYRVDRSIPNMARTLASRLPEWASGCNLSEHPEGRGSPAIHVGSVGSGNKVLDDINDPSFAPVLRLWPKLLGVEMEGLGAAEATQDLNFKGMSIVLSMVRGISDVPRGQAHSTQHEGQAPAQSIERDRWKAFASEAAAGVLGTMIRNSWPRPPRV